MWVQGWKCGGRPAGARMGSMGNNREKKKITTIERMKRCEFKQVTNNVFFGSGNARRKVKCTSI